MFSNKHVKLTMSLFVLLANCLLGLPVQAKYGGGAGEPNDPYLIYTAEQLNEIGLNEDDWDKHFKLMADIDLGHFDGKDGGPRFNMIGTYECEDWCWGAGFAGVFDGNDCTISNFTVDWGWFATGLFRHIAGGIIKDMRLVNPDVNGGSAAGSLVGQFSAGTITGCFVEGGCVSGTGSAGGLVGRNGKCMPYVGCCCSGGTISDCSVIGTCVSGDWTVGGLVGLNYGTITNCYVEGGSVAGRSSLGGLVGSNYEGSITDCYSTSSVSGSTHVGGLVGGNSHGTIANCYSVSSVSGETNVGGLVGYNEYAEITFSFWDIETSGQDTSAGGTGLPTAEMQMEATFTDAGWDFVGETANGTDDIWWIREGLYYPQLWWERPVLHVEVRIVPHTINPASKGKWIAAFLWLPEDCNVADIDPNSVFLEGEIQAEPLYINEQKQIARAKFSREEVRNILNIGEAELQITGRLIDGTRFKGKDNIKIIDNNSEHEPEDPNSKHEKKDHSLVAHWKFDDGSGSVALDSAKRNDGTLIGDPTWTTGIIDGAISFDGDGDYVAVDAIDALAGDTFTIQAWICVSESAGLYNPILTQHDLNNDGCYFYVANGSPAFYIFDSPVYVQATSPATINTDQWYHVAITNDGTELKLYVDGMLKATASSVDLTGADYNAYIACEPDTPLYYTGMIDDVRIYDRTLTADEIAMPAD